MFGINNINILHVHNIYTYIKKFAVNSTVLHIFKLANKI